MTALMMLRVSQSEQKNHVIQAGSYKIFPDQLSDSLLITIIVDFLSVAGCSSLMLIRYIG